MNHARGTAESENRRARLAESSPAQSVFPEPPLGGWLRAAREACGVTQKAVATKLGFRRQAWAQLELSEARGAISLYSLRRAADALGYDFVYALVPRQGAPSLAKGTGYPAGNAMPGTGSEKGTGYSASPAAMGTGPSKENASPEGTGSIDWAAEELPTELR